MSLPKRYLNKKSVDSSRLLSLVKLEEEMASAIKLQPKPFIKPFAQLLLATSLA